MSKRTCIMEISFLLLLALAFAWATALERQQQRIANSMLRLHVVAASDREQDQEQKLLVRDAVLEAATPFLLEAGTSEEAIMALGNHLSTLEQAANDTLCSLESPHRVRVTLNRELFGTRQYDTFCLPGGYYDTLRVTIGAGEGHNWWCVVYPQICMASSLEQQEAVAVMAGMNPEDISLLQGQTREYQLKFKALELFEDLMGWFRAMGRGIPTSG